VSHLNAKPLLTASCRSSRNGFVFRFLPSWGTTDIIVIDVNIRLHGSGAAQSQATAELKIYACALDKFKQHGRGLGLSIEARPTLMLL
jgi:hypothetical protein